MDYALINKLIEEEIIDFNRLLLKNYKTIGLSEIEAFVLIELNNLKKRGITFIAPSKIIKKLTIKEDEVMKILDELMQKKYVSFRMIKETSGKETEDFSLENTYKKIIDIYIRKIKDEVLHTDKTYDSLEEEIADLIETQFQKQLKPSDIELIQKWIHEYNYSKENIKEAVLFAIRANKSSLGYIDGVLLNMTKPKKTSKTTKNNSEKSEALKKFFDSWEQK
jgi:DNA replication protein